LPEHRQRLILQVDYTVGTRGERPQWFQPSAKEHMACRENAVLFDQTSFAKISIQVSLNILGWEY
jgi:glycine cleavage system aminomethyltransferase T